MTSVDVLFLKCLTVVRKENVPSLAQHETHTLLPTQQHTHTNEPTTYIHFCLFGSTQTMPNRTRGEHAASSLAAPPVVEAFTHGNAVRHDTAPAIHTAIIRVPSAHHLDNSAVQQHMHSQHADTTVVRLQPADGTQQPNAIAGGPTFPPRAFSTASRRDENPLFYSVTAHALHGNRHRHHLGSFAHRHECTSRSSSRSGASTVDDPPLEYSPQWYTDDDDSNFCGSPLPSRAVSATHHWGQSPSLFPSPRPTGSKRDALTPEQGDDALQHPGSNDNSAASWASDRFPHASALFPSSDTNGAMATADSPVPSD